MKALKTKSGEVWHPVVEEYDDGSVEVWEGKVFEEESIEEIRDPWSIAHLDGLCKNCMRMMVF